MSNLENTNPITDNPVNNHPTNLSNSDVVLQNPTVNGQQITEQTPTTQQIAEQQKARIEQQKEAIRQYASKAKKTGFTRGLFSGIILVLLAFVICSLLAKDQVINTMDYLNSLIPTEYQNLLNTNNTKTKENTETSEENNLSNIEKSETIDEEKIEKIDEVQEYYDKIDEILSSEHKQETKVELLRNMLTETMQRNEKTDKLNQYISQTIVDLTTNLGEIQNEKNTIGNSDNIDEDKNNTDDEIDNFEYDNKTEEENTELTTNDIQTIAEEINSEDNTTEDKTTENKNEKKYTITHVTSEDEANRVLPAHCNDLTCYGDEEFIECTSFQIVEDLNESATRVGRRGCRYKDISELVYVDFQSDMSDSIENSKIELYE